MLVEPLTLENLGASAANARTDWNQSDSPRSGVAVRVRVRICGTIQYTIMEGALFPA